MNHIELTIAAITAQRDRLNSLLDGLNAFTRGEQAVPIRQATEAEAPKKQRAVKRSAPRREVTTPALQESGIMAKLDKPDTLAGAMKRVIHGLRGSFDLGTVKVGLMADPDFNKILEASAPSSPISTFSYWIKSGKLAASGDSYVVVDMEFFNR
jgi:hypothetical protein